MGKNSVTININWIKSIRHSKTTVPKWTPFSLSRKTLVEVGVTKGRSELNHSICLRSFLLPLKTSVPGKQKRGWGGEGRALVGIGYLLCEFGGLKRKLWRDCCHSKMIPRLETKGKRKHPSFSTHGISRETFPPKACCFVSRRIYIFVIC